MNRGASASSWTLTPSIRRARPRWTGSCRPSTGSSSPFRSRRGEARAAPFACSTRRRESRCPMSSLASTGERPEAVWPGTATRPASSTRATRAPASARPRTWTSTSRSGSTGSARGWKTMSTRLAKTFRGSRKRLFEAPTTGAPFSPRSRTATAGRLPSSCSNPPGPGPGFPPSRTKPWTGVSGRTARFICFRRAARPGEKSFVSRPRRPRSRRPGSSCPRATPSSVTSSRRTICSMSWTSSAGPTGSAFSTTRAGRKGTCRSFRSPRSARSCRSPATRCSSSIRATARPEPGTGRGRAGRSSARRWRRSRRPNSATPRSCARRPLRRTARESRSPSSARRERNSTEAGRRS